MRFSTVLTFVPFMVAASPVVALAQENTPTQTAVPLTGKAVESVDKPAVEAEASASPSQPAESETAQVKQTEAAVSQSLATLPSRPVDLESLEALLDEPVVTTASLSPEQASVAPSTVVTISSDELRRYGIRRLDEALNYLGLGLVAQDPMGLRSGAVEVGSRGVLITRDGNKHMLVLVNGHVMNQQGSGSALVEAGMGIPIEMIDHVELMLGPGSVLYGSNAMFGVINVVTKSLKDYTGARAVAELGTAPPNDLSGQVKTPIRSSEMAKIYRLSLGKGGTFSLFGKEASAVGQVDYSFNQSPEHVFGPQPQGADPGPNVARPGYWGGPASMSVSALTGFGQLKVGDFTLDTMALVHSRRSPIQGNFNDPDNINQTKAFRFDLRHNATLSTRATLSSRLSGDNYDNVAHSSWSDVGDCLDYQTNGCVYEQRGTSRWGTLEEQLTVDWGLNGKFVTTAGGMMRVRQSTSRTDFTDLKTGQGSVRGSDSQIDLVEKAGAAYLQQVWNPIDLISFNGGVRLDADQAYDSRLSPRAAVLLHLSSLSTLKFVYSEAFRAPAPYERTDVDPSYRIPAPNLGPETVKSAEVQWIQRVNRGQFMLGAFWNDWRDLVSNRGITDEQFKSALASGTLSPSASIDNIDQYSNQDRIRAYGANGSMSWKPIEGFEVAGNLTITKARQILDDPMKEDLKLAVMPAWVGNLRMAYKPAPEGSTFAIAAFFTGERNTERGIRGKFGDNPPISPGQLLLRGTVSGPFGGWKGVSYRLILEHAHASTNPYVIGPLQKTSKSDPTRHAELVPVNRFTILGGLQYEF
jgi:outer membrane receptor for ferrienterochelin and colicins